MNEAATVDRQATYEDVERRLGALLEDETDWIAAMATVACELHHAFHYYHWTGFTVRYPTIFW